MTSFFGNMNTPRAALFIGLLVLSCQQVCAQPLISYSSQAPQRSQPTVPQPLRADQKVISAGFQTPPAEAGSTVGNLRLLPPPTRTQIGAPAEGRIASTPQAPAFVIPKIESFTTASAGLAIVVGLFLVCMWLLRRAGPKPTSPLPTEAVAVLGRVPLAARNFAHLLQVGNKLVLVAITPDGVAPITEVTDPAEVQRLLGLCLRTHKQSTTAEFHNVLQQLAKEPASGFLGNDVAATYASQSR